MIRFENAEVVKRHGKVGMVVGNLLMDPVTDLKDVQAWIDRFEPTDEYVLAKVDTLVEGKNDKSTLRRAYALYIDYKNNSLFNSK